MFAFGIFSKPFKHFCRSLWSDFRFWTWRFFGRANIEKDVLTEQGRLSVIDEGREDFVSSSGALKTVDLGET